MNVATTALPGVLLLDAHRPRRRARVPPRALPDLRISQAHGIGPFVQSNHSRSRAASCAGCTGRCRRRRRASWSRSRAARSWTWPDLRRDAPTFGRWTAQRPERPGAPAGCGSRPASRTGSSCAARSPTCVRDDRAVRAGGRARPGVGRSGGWAIDWRPDDLGMPRSDADPLRARPLLAASTSCSADDLFDGQDARDHAERMLVTGGAGFIGSALVRELLRSTPHEVVTLDALTYAGHRSLAGRRPWTTPATPSFTATSPTRRGRELLDRTDPTRCCTWRPRATSTAASTARRVPAHERGRHVHVCSRPHARNGRAATTSASCTSAPTRSSAASAGRPSVRPRHALRPAQPLLGVEGGSDHLARAWFHTYGLPVVVTNCSNNYGPRQYPEKLIPTMVLRAARGEPAGVRRGRLRCATGCT